MRDAGLAGTQLVSDECVPVATASVAAEPSSTLGKPRMRGRLHAFAAGVSMMTGVVLVAFAATQPAVQAGWSTALYSLTIVLLFSVSGLYHRRHWSERARMIMKRLDHSMIFVFIATRARRPPKMTPDRIALAREMYDSRAHTVDAIAKFLGVSRPTIYRHLDSRGG